MGSELRWETVEENGKDRNKQEARMEMRCVKLRGGGGAQNPAAVTTQPPQPQLVSHAFLSQVINNKSFSKIMHIVFLLTVNKT